MTEVCNFIQYCNPFLTPLPHMRLWFLKEINVFSIIQQKFVLKTKQQLTGHLW